MAYAPDAQGSGVGWQQSGAVATGKVGTPVSKGKQIVLTIVTFGIWAYVWTYKQFNETKDYSGEGLGGGLGVLLSLVTGGLVTIFMLPGEIEKNLYQRTGRQSPVNTMTGVFGLIPFVGGLIWYLKVQDALNDFWVSQGAQPAA